VPTGRASLPVIVLCSAIVPDQFKLGTAQAASPANDAVLPDDDDGSI